MVVAFNQSMFPVIGALKHLGKIEDFTICDQKKFHQGHKLSTRRLTSKKSPDPNRKCKAFHKIYPQDHQERLW